MVVARIDVTPDKVLMDTYKHIDLPIGTIIMNAGNNGGTSFGNAFLLCDGSSKLVSAYPELYAIISTKYGTDSAGYFNVPNFTQRFPMGLLDVSGNQISNDTYKSPTARQGGNLQIQSNQFLHGHPGPVSPVVTGVNYLGYTDNIDNESPFMPTATVLTYSGNQVITQSHVDNLPVCYTLNYFIYTGKGIIG